MPAWSATSNALRSSGAERGVAPAEQSRDDARCAELDTGTSSVTPWMQAQRDGLPEGQPLAQVVSVAGSAESAGSAVPRFRRARTIR